MHSPSFRTPARALALSVLILSPIAACSDDATTSPAANARAGAPAPAPDASFEIAAPVFGLATSPDGGLLAAQPLLGVSELRKGAAALVASIEGVTGVAAIGRGNLLAITGEPEDFSILGDSRKLFRITGHTVRPIADFWQFEQTVNPDQAWNDGAPDSNPFNIASLDGTRALVSDAGANAILIVDQQGAIDWVAILTPHPVPTSQFAELIGCGAPCPLPPEIDAQPVATSIAVGPDGHYYAGELTGFPGMPGYSRIWRITAGSRHVTCPGPSCTKVADGLTSIMDMKFGPDGRLYVVELDAAGWLAVEIMSQHGELGPVSGGTVKSCNVTTGSCTVRASGLSLPSAITFGKDGTLWVAENSIITPQAGHTATIRAIP